MYICSLENASVSAWKSLKDVDGEEEVWACMDG